MNVQSKAKLLTREQIQQGAQAELDRLDRENLQATWYDRETQTERSISLTSLPLQKQQAIRESLQAFAKGDFISLDEYEEGLRSRSS